MCAIAGFLNLQYGDDVTEKMLRSMVRRGPDGSGVFRDRDCTLLHTRLAIIDRLGGSQPMTLSWAGERYTIVYNGELYNTSQLRRELEKLGHRFLGHSDTEVLLHGFAQWGEGVLEKLNGIFAFGVWQEGRKKLFLARDRIGVKPLFYTLHKGGLVFASEIKTILCCPTVRPELDAQGAAEILMLGPGRLPGSGVFRDIRELEPGYCGWYEAGKLKLRRYWKLRDREHRDSFADTAAHVRELVLDTVKRQMVSDVPIGTFLSGGLDSSIITAICAGELAERGELLPTFSVDYENNDKFFVPGKFQPNSDGEYIEIMRAALGTRHSRTELTAEDLMAALEDATVARDLPGMADVDFSLLSFCREIRKSVKVGLSGECADEIFGGYPWYRDPEVRALEGFPWAQNTDHRLSLLHPDIRREIDGRALVMDSYRDTCVDSDILPDNSDLERRMKQMVNLNFRWFMQTLLDRKDRMSMYSGLEVRVPFCDYRIAEYLYAVPWEFKDWQGKEKGLLRHAMEGLLPEQVLWRKKSPYPKTFDPKYAQMVSDRLRSLLEYGNAPLFAMVDRSAVEQLFDASPVWPWYGQLMRVPQTMAFLLQIDFWLRNYQIQILW